MVAWQPRREPEIFAVAQAARFYLTDASVPSQFVQMLPYGVTLLVLLFVGKRVKGPEALANWWISSILIYSEL